MLPPEIRCRLIAIERRIGMSSPVGSCHLSWHVLSLSVAQIVNYSVNLQAATGASHDD
jgi:hypothetical protein